MLESRENISQIGESPRSEKDGAKSPVTEKEDDPKYPPMRTVLLVMAALYVAMFLVALDRIIISTAVPRITDEFRSIQDIGWYGSAYVLTSCATQLLFGRLYSFYNNKVVFLCAIGLFEIGSVICGAAPNSTAFILGRAIAGSGSAGVFSGAVVITVPLVPLSKRPLLQGFMGAIFGVSSVLGPLIGGAFTNSEHLTWRWCFYINLPIGAVSFFLILLFLHHPAPPNKELEPLEKLRRMDPLGNLFFTPSITSLLLALQWGGSEYPWSNPRIVALLVVFGVLFTIWVVIQARAGDNATVPPRVFLNRSIIAGMAWSMCVGATMLSVAYYLSIWFQAIQGVDALTSGIRSIPFVLALVVASIVSGGGTTRSGYYAPFVVAGACILPVGTGLLTTLKPTSGSPEWIGFQVLAGFGMGLGMQVSSVAAQVVLKAEDVSTGVSLMFFGQSLGGAIFLCVAQNVFIQELVKDLSEVLPAASVRVLAGVGATDLRGAVPVEKLADVLGAYNKAIVTAFYVALGVSCLGIVPALGFEWKSVKGAKGRKADTDVEATG